MSVPGPDYDVAIVGGGPGGASMAAYLARAGVKCGVFEREVFPREHVGESLVPSSTRVFHDIGFLDKMLASDFPKKYGAAWTAAAGNQMYEHGWEGLMPQEHVDIAFRERDQAGVHLDHTWHVDRGRFDAMLLEHAEEAGARVMQGVPVTRVHFPEGDHVRVDHTVGGRTSTATARMVVDASGRRTLLGNQLKWKIADDVFDQYALHTWFEDYDRLVVAKQDRFNEYIFIHFLPITNSWIWQIPITDRITSIGVVTQKRHFAAAKGSHEQFFWRCIGSRPELEGALRAATQLRPLKAEGDYSYAMQQIADDRVVLVGDAARFVDPIFSTGVSIALNSSRFACRDILRGLETGDLSKEAFSEYEATLRRGTRNWYTFITLYYRLNLVFTAFIRDARYRHDVLKLLQGDVYDDEEPAVLAEMRRVVQGVESNERHIWHRSLGDLTSNAFSPAF